MAASVSDGRAQSVSNVDRDLAAFYAQLETLIKAGDGATFLGMLAPTADAVPAKEFADQQFVPGATHAVVHERDREPMTGPPDGTSFNVLLDLFVEFGQRGSARTWRLTLTRPSISSTAWRIEAPERVASVEGLYRLTIDRTKQYRIHNLRVTAEDLTITMPKGVAFGAVTPEGPTAFVLLGRGELRFAPAPASERGQVRIVSGEDTLRSQVDAVFVRLNPWDLRDRLSDGGLTEMPVDQRELRRADAIFAEEVPKSFGLELNDLSRDAWSLVPPFGDFLAEMRTSRFGTLTYARSGGEPEDITVFDRKRRRNIAVYSSVAKLAARGSRYYSDEDEADYDVEHYLVQAHLDPRREWIEGRTEMRLRIREAAAGSLTLRLAEPLAVRSVTSPALGRLLTLRVKGQNSVIVSLPKPLAKGDALTLNVTYNGRLAGASPEREALTLTGQEAVVQDLAMMAPEPRLIYTNRSYWYPQAPATDYATATLRLTIPVDLTCVASGVPATGNPVRLEASGATEARRLYVFVVDRPARYLAVAVSRLEQVVSTRVPARPPTSPDQAPAGGHATPPQTEALSVAIDPLPIGILANPRQTGRARALQEQVNGVWSTYADIIGEFPYSTFTLALVDDALPGGHSPAYFALLHQPLPTSPYSWRNDPVSFDGFPQFFLAHEIAHQFWGNAVGWENYHEQWISEGFAQYFAVLYAERTRPRGDFEDVLRQLRRTAAANSRHGPVWLGYRLGHLQGDGRVFRALVYNKGALVLHMLRRLIGDEPFFKGLRRFYRDSRFKKVGTGDVQRAFEAESGLSLTRFFERWILESEIPTVRASVRIDGPSRPSGGGGGAGQVAVVKLEHVGEVVDVPLTVTLEYASGQTEDVLVRLTEKVSETRVPLKGALRNFEVNRDHAALVDVVRD